MNGLEIIVLGIIALCGIIGYHTGFLRVVYSLVSWLLILAFVTWSTPYLTEYLEKNTSLQVTIQEKCLDYIEQKSEEKIQQQTKAYQEEQQETLQDADILLPKELIDEITGSTADTIGEVLENAGIYEEMATTVAHFTIEGIAFFIALIVAGILMHLIARALDIVSHIPVLHGTNKILGAGAGVIKGLVITWLVFYIITLCSTSELGGTLLTYIKESRFLLYLYQNNILLQVIVTFL